MKESVIIGNFATTKSGALVAITVGGGIAGALDLAQALILFGRKIPLLIAGGLLGRQAVHGGGTGIYALGIVLHFFIAFSFAAFYYATSRRLIFLKEYPLVCGLFYGAAVEEVMNSYCPPALGASRNGSLHTS